MNTRKIPMRKCLATGEILPKKELIRIVKTPEGNVIVDLTSKVNGRGAYLKKSLEAVEKAIKTKCLSKALECDIPLSVYEDLKKIV